MPAPAAPIKPHRGGRPRKPSPSALTSGELRSEELALLTLSGPEQLQHALHTAERRDEFVAIGHT
jgi:hypothetical protein